MFVFSFIKPRTVPESTKEALKEKSVIIHSLSSKGKLLVKIAYKVEFIISYYLFSKKLKRRLRLILHSGFQGSILSLLQLNVFRYHITWSPYWTISISEDMPQSFVSRERDSMPGFTVPNFLITMPAYLITFTQINWGLRILIKCLLKFPSSCNLFYVLSKSTQFDIRNFPFSLTKLQAI